MPAIRSDAQLEIETALSSLSKEIDDMRGIAWYSDRATVALILGEYMKFHFGRKGNETWALRLRIQCEGSETARVQAVVLDIDGKDHPVSAGSGDWARDRGSGKVWDMLDIPVSERQPDLARALAGAREVMVRLRSDERSWQWPVPRPQLEALGRVHAVWAAVTAAGKTSRS
jgi:hypothetical protein